METTAVPEHKGITSAQLKAMQVVAGEKQIKPKQLRRLIHFIYGRYPEGLSQQEARDMLDRLRTYEGDDEVSVAPWGRP